MKIVQGMQMFPKALLYTLSCNAIYKIHSSSQQHQNVSDKSTINTEKMTLTN